jgi:hypothetical protein
MEERAQLQRMVAAAVEHLRDAHSRGSRQAGDEAVNHALAVVEFVGDYAASGDEKDEAEWAQVKARWGRSDASGTRSPRDHDDAVGVLGAWLDAHD